MSERLTDEQLEGMSRWMEESDLPAFAMYCGPVAARELRTRRAADLTAEERRALSFLLDHVVSTFAPCRDKGAILDTLDRLLAGGGK